MIFTSCFSALGMLTFQLVSLSKPVGPFNEKANFNLRIRIESRTHFRISHQSHYIFFKEQLLWRYPRLYLQGSKKTLQEIASGRAIRYIFFSIFVTSIIKKDVASITNASTSLKN